ncbi:MAG: imelysin family protein [Rhodobacteraceae bacterium]|nr:imelysin family protein [Paracoccaceae bacterium]MCY4249618.1 imelysin family protein [Paracoccaceae bacterium]
MRLTYLALMVVIPATVFAQERASIVNNVVDNHILVRFAALANAVVELKKESEQSCEVLGINLRPAFNKAFDAWISAGHLRFGPTEYFDRGFALSFWPDTRGRINRTLNSLISELDPVVDDPEEFMTVSVAGRGFFALEMLLYDSNFINNSESDYLCRLIRAISRDISSISTNIHNDWEKQFAHLLRNPNPEGIYRNEEEVLRALFTSLATGLEFTSDLHLGRPLGTIDRSRPNRAEARRSSRSQRHVELSLLALRELSFMLSESNSDTTMLLDSSFAKAQASLALVDSPDLSTVVEPEGQMKLQEIRNQLEQIREMINQVLAQDLGIAAGFNSLDGD